MTTSADSSEDAYNIEHDAQESKTIDAERADKTAPRDGGLRAWLRVLGSFLVLANTMGLQSSFGAFQSFYEHDLLSSYSASEIAWIGTIQIFCSSSGGLITGPLFDLGYDKPIVLLGCFFAVLAYMMTSLSTAYYQVFLAQGICGGLAGTCVFAPVVALTAIEFEKRRALAVGIATSGFVFGAVIYPITFRQLQPTIGFPWTCRVLAFIALGCFLIAYPLVYWKTPRQKTEARQVLDLKAWKEPPYALYGFAVLFMYAGYWPPYFFITEFAAEAVGTSLSTGFYILAISNAANMLARYSGTLLADKFGVMEVLIISNALSAVVAFCWVAVHTTAELIAWAVFWGYFSGIMSSLFAAVVPSLSPDRSVVGTRLGMVNGLFGIGALVSSPIAGALISVQGNHVHRIGGYLGMQMWVASLLVASTVLFIYPLVYLRRTASRDAKS